MRRSITIRRTVFRGLVPALALGLTTGCGSSSGPEKELETVRSWTATAALATDERRAGAISDRYAAGLVDAARAARADAAQSLSSAGTSASNRAKTALALDSLDQAIGRLAALDAAQ
jgi:hypothetical protein